MIRLLPLAVLALAVVACSDRVPAPVTPTPSPRPGYPPAPVSELPEGVLYVNKQDLPAPPLFRLEAGREAEKQDGMTLDPVSPDGSRAVAQTYYDGETVVEIGLMIGGRYETIARGRLPMAAPWLVWSNDSRRLAYALADEADPANASIWALDTGSGEKTLLANEPGPYWLLGWTAAGEVLARTPDRLMIFGRNQREMASPEEGEIVDAALSPDGRLVAVKLGEFEYEGERGLTYIHSSGIWVGGLAEGGWRKIVDLAGEPPEVVAGGSSPMLWSPDGRRITTSLTRMDERGLTGDTLTVLDVLTGEEMVVHDQGWGWESWSPDGRYLAYMYYRTKSGSARELRLWLLGPDGQRREVEASVRYMTWTKDGRLLVDIPARLSLLDPETMELEEVLTGEGETISAFVESSVWSPSGRYVALSTPSDALHRSSLYIVDTETGQANLFLDEAGFWARAWLRE